MKYLEIDEFYRQYLAAKDALVLDDDGNEALLGLTAGESVEYLAVMSTADISKKIKAGADPERMLTLYERHTAAMKDRPSIFDLKWWSGL